MAHIVGTAFLKIVTKKPRASSPSAMRTGLSDGIPTSVHYVLPASFGKLYSTLLGAGDHQDLGIVIAIFFYFVYWSNYYFEAAASGSQAVGGRLEPTDYIFRKTEMQGVK